MEYTASDIEFVHGRLVQAAQPLPVFLDGDDDSRVPAEMLRASVVVNMKLDQVPTRLFISRLNPPTRHQSISAIAVKIQDFVFVPSRKSVSFQGAD